MSYNRHGIKTEQKHVFFFSFKGGSVSSLDQITLPPETGLDHQRMYHRFGEWLKREGHAWEHLSEEELCKLAVEFFNQALGEGEKPRKFDRMALKKEYEKFI